MDSKIKKIKEPKKKPPYNVMQNVRFVFANLWKWDKSYIFMSFLRIPVNVLLPLLGIYMSKYVVDIVTNNGSFERLLLYILVFSLSMLALNGMSNFTNAKTNWKSFNIRIKYQALVNEKSIDADYENIENPDVQIKSQKAFDATYRRTEEMVVEFIIILSSITSFITYGIIMFTLSPVLILLLSAAAVGTYFPYRIFDLWSYRNRDKWAPIDRKLSYIQRSAGDFSNAKDIKLYNISEWLITLFKSILKERMSWVIKRMTKLFISNLIVFALESFVQKGISYGYLIYKMLTTNMAVSDFVLYFGVISSFYSCVSELLWNVTRIKNSSLNICDLREFLDYPDKSNRGKGIDLPSETCEIEFKNVSFKYPQNENYTIEKLSFKIKKGEKVAVVGLNGAGKTTLIKLMCGLYRPSEGEITVNGRNIQEYNRDEYYTLFSAVFQDIYLMPVSVSKNIALQEYSQIEYDKVADILKLSGLYEKIESLPNGSDTLLIRSFSEDAIELSGGEKQKLALARALYKDGKIIVLDEPTAALDPIAESEMYQKYDKLTAGRTAVYISHRLSSTRFCDRIFFLENGKITETGNHNELIKKCGKYAEMFELQSHYYKENTNQDLGEAAENV